MFSTTSSLVLKPLNRERKEDIGRDGTEAINKISTFIRAKE